MTGGGTGGHVNPALAIADIIKEKHPDAEIIFIGTKNGIENGGTIHFEGMELPSSTEKTRLNILRNNYYKFCIKGVTDYNTDTFIEVVPFDDVNNDIVFE